MKTERTIVTYTCDLCGKECEPIRELKIPHPKGGNIHMKICAYIEYATASGDVCKTCFENAISSYLLKT